MAMAPRMFFPGGRLFPNPLCSGLRGGTWRLCVLPALNIRIVRFPLEKADGSVTWECFATNLSEEEFTAQDLKELYRLRWNEESSFNHLKHHLSIGRLRSRTLGGIEQDRKSVV